MKTKFKNAKGITLIALVITIIVLLILAGVAIATLTGDNGVLTKAESAKTSTEIAEVKEQAQLDIFNWQTDKIKNGENASLNDSIVKSIIEEANAGNTNKYYSSIDDTKIYTKNGYEILISELYTKSGEGGNTGSVKVTLADGSTVNLTKETFGEYLGKKVTNYKTIGGTETVTVGSNSYQVSTTYRLYYIDFDNKYKEGAGTVYLKADQGPNNHALQLDGNEATSKIKNLNPSLYAEGVTAPINTNNNMKAVTWLTDTAKWNGLMTSGTNSEIGNKVNYVIGAPSLEMMMDSYNEHYKLTGDIPDYTDIPASPDTTRKKLFYKYTAGKAGYQVGPNADSDLEYSNYTSDNSVKTDSEIDSMYYPGTNKNYWLASPSVNDSDTVMFVGGTYGGLVNLYGSSNGTGFCPLVSLQSNVNLKLAN